MSHTLGGEKSMVCFLVMHGWLLISMQATLFYSRTFGEDFVIVNSEKIARILADQRSTTYSNGPRSPLYRMWASWETFTRSSHHQFPYSFSTNHMRPFLQYGNKWKMHRKVFHPSLGMTLLIGIKTYTSVMHTDHSKICGVIAQISVDISTSIFFAFPLGYF